MGSINSGGVAAKAIFGLASVAVVGTLAVASGVGAAPGNPSTGNKPTSKEACKKGGFATFGFKNQGQCVSFVARGDRSEGYTGEVEAQDDQGQDVEKNDDHKQSDDKGKQKSARTSDR